MPTLPADQLLDLIIQSLEGDKAQDVVTLRLDGRTVMADAMIIASGRSQRHVGALADNLLRHLKEAGLGRASAEGMPNCDWVLIDAGDVIVHLFKPEVRAFYNLEDMWAADAPDEIARPQ